MTAAPHTRALGPARRFAAGRTRWRRFIRIDRGSAPLELAIVAPAVLLLVFGVLQTCLVFHARQIALAAAQQGADAARAYDAPAGAGTARAQAFLSQAAGDSLVATSVTVTASAGQVAVTVEGSAISLLPGVSFHIWQTSAGPREVVTTP
jgi:Flp pilus assembly protein TadG